MERLDKFLCDSGAGTRSQVKAMVKSGRVWVDGVPERDSSRKIDPAVQTVTLDGVPLRGSRRIVGMLNKPAGFVTATEDASQRTGMELLPGELVRQGVKPVGRLDKDTEGLLLFTNDGDLAHRLISPKHGIEKTYYAEHAGTADETDIAAFAAGCVLRDGTVCRPAVLEILGEGKCLVRVCEGKYHQVRRMLASRGKPVSYLRRIAEGGVALGTLPLGMTRELTEEEVILLESVDFDEKNIRRS